MMDIPAPPAGDTGWARKFRDAWDGATMDGDEVKRGKKLPPTLNPVLSSNMGRTLPGSSAYWERRYGTGRNSGPGSYNRLARFKADTVNNHIAENRIESVMEFGCGDGNQLALLRCPRYCGIDVSATAVAHCRRTFAADRSRRFALRGEIDPGERFDCGLSLDVIYHLLEDHVFEEHMGDLFTFATKAVIIYSSNFTQDEFEERYKASSAPHVFHRRFTDWIGLNQPLWKLVQWHPNAYPFDMSDQENTSFADFHVFGRA